MCLWSEGLIHLKFYLFCYYMYSPLIFSSKCCDFCNCFGSMRSLLPMQIVGTGKVGRCLQSLYTYSVGVGSRGSQMVQHSQCH